MGDHGKIPSLTVASKHYITIHLQMSVPQDSFQSYPSQRYCMHRLKTVQRRAGKCWAGRAQDRERECRIVQDSARKCKRGQDSARQCRKVQDIQDSRILQDTEGLVGRTAQDCVRQCRTVQDCARQYMTVQDSARKGRTVLNSTGQGRNASTFCK
jgi:hypothetical protein